VVPHGPARDLLTTADGHSLCFAQWGDLSGSPVVFMHGTPGGRLNRHPDEGVYVELGIRWITYDRPGYGGSDRLPGRSIVSCVTDVAAIVDALRIERFAVTGSSGGGPHVLAVASLLGQQVVRARCNVGLAPYDAAGLDFFAGMDPLNVAEFEWALEGEERLAPELERELSELAERLAADRAQLMLGDAWDLDEADRAILAAPSAADMNRQVATELVTSGKWGWVDDSLAFVRPWGFAVDDISVPIRVTYGSKDVVVPPQHGAWLGAHIPGADVIVDDVSGHLEDLEAVKRSLQWLVAPE
jgi:pimeloyl-ACP methyl ester carboxylesterase